MMRIGIKGLSISIGLVLVLGLTSCSSRAKNVKTENMTPAVAAVEEQAPPESVMEADLEALKDKAQAEGALLPVYFDFDKYNLKPESEKTLDKAAAWLSKNSTVKIKIEGNCDERGTMEYNIALGDRRANSAKEYLIKIGVAAHRLETVSWGKEKPLDPGHNEAARAKNRRDDFNPTSQ
jgi:peptidoglycan-associated lipoprotein